MAKPFGLGFKTLGLMFIIIGLGCVVMTCDKTILKVNAPMFVDVFLAIKIIGDEYIRKNIFFHVPRPNVFMSLD
jgi:hypothetical protein